MGDAAERRASFDELYVAIQALPEGLTGEILEPGTIRTMSRPGSAHGFASRRALRALGDVDQSDRGRGWWLEVEREIRFPLDRLVVPDVAGWRVDAPGTPGFITENPVLRLPDFACEILSVSTARDDRRVKLPLFAASGVAHVWLIDPSARLVEVYETRAQAPTLIATAKDDDVVVLVPFGVEVRVGDLWMPEPTAP
jgi:Uma2 family endonuclease